MPRAWRITKSAHASKAFDGEGARRFGGRWNSPGTPVVYTAQGESLASLEILVHLQASQLLTSYCSIPADFDDSLVESVDPASLSPNWRESPAPSALARFGDRWAGEQRSVVLAAPSAIVPSELIYVLNPLHREFRRVVVGSPRAFRFDRRLK